VPFPGQGHDNLKMIVNRGELSIEVLNIGSLGKMSEASDGAMPEQPYVSSANTVDAHHVCCATIRCELFNRNAESLRDRLPHG
jgi:hypothetical protein